MDNASRGEVPLNWRTGDGLALELNANRGRIERIAVGEADLTGQGAVPLSGFRVMDFTAEGDTAPLAGKLRLYHAPKGGPAFQPDLMTIAEVVG